MTGDPVPVVVTPVYLLSAATIHNPAVVKTWLARADELSFSAF